MAIVSPEVTSSASRGPGVGDHGFSQPIIDLSQRCGRTDGGAVVSRISSRIAGTIGAGPFGA